MSNRRGLIITRGTTKPRPFGQALKKKRGGKLDPDTCQLGGLSKGNTVCGEEIVETIGNIGICAKHRKRLNAIKRASDKKHSQGLKPQTQVFRRANAA